MLLLLRVNNCHVLHEVQMRQVSVKQHIPDPREELSHHRLLQIRYNSELLKVFLRIYQLEFHFISRVVFVKS